MKTAVCAIAVAAVAAGCSSAAPGGAAGAGTAEPEKKEPVKLQFWGGVPEDAGPKEVVDAWNAAHPNIQVEYIRYVNDDSGNLKLDTTLMTGDGADIYLSHNLFRVKKRVQIGGALDLSQFKDYNVEQKLGKEAADWKVDNKYYSLPTVHIKYLMLLNKKALDEANLPVPYDWTWEQMEDYARKLKKDNRWGLVQNIGVTPIMASVDGALNAAGFYKADGSSNFDLPLMRTGLERLNKMMNEDKTTPTYGQQVSTKMPVDQLFLKGEAAMYNSGSFEMRNASNVKTYPRDFKIAFALTPKLSADMKDYKWPSGVNDAIAINPNSKHTKEAWEFVKWYTDGGLMPMVKGGRIPLSNAVKKDDLVKLLTDGVADYYDLDSLNKVVLGNFPTFTNPLAQQETDLRKEEYERYFTGNKTLDEAIKSMTKRHNDFITQNKGK